MSTSMSGNSGPLSTEVVDIKMEINDDDEDVILVSISVSNEAPVPVGELEAYVVSNTGAKYTSIEGVTSLGPGKQRDWTFEFPLDSGEWTFIIENRADKIQLGPYPHDYEYSATQGRKLASTIGSSLFAGAFSDDLGDFGNVTEREMIDPSKVVLTSYAAENASGGDTLIKSEKNLNVPQDEHFSESKINLDPISAANTAASLFESDPDTNHSSNISNNPVQTTSIEEDDEKINAGPLKPPTSPPKPPVSPPTPPNKPPRPPSDQPMQSKSVIESVEDTSTPPKPPTSPPAGPPKAPPGPPSGPPTGPPKPSTKPSESVQNESPGPPTPPSNALNDPPKGPSGPPNGPPSGPPSPPSGPPSGPPKGPPTPPSSPPSGPSKGPPTPPSGPPSGPPKGPPKGPPSRPPADFSKQENGTSE